MRPPPGVGDFGDARLFLDDDLRVPGDASALHRGQTQRLVEGVGVQRLRAPEHGGHGLDHRAHHVVVRVLRGGAVGELGPLDTPGDLSKAGARVYLFGEGPA